MNESDQPQNTEKFSHTEYVLENEVVQKVAFALQYPGSDIEDNASSQASFTQQRKPAVDSFLTRPRNASHAQAEDAFPRAPAASTNHSPTPPAAPDDHAAASYISKMSTYHNRNNNLTSLSEQPPSHDHSPSTPKPPPSTSPAEQNAPSHPSPDRTSTESGAPNTRNSPSSLPSNDTPPQSAPSPQDTVVLSFLLSLARSNPPTHLLSVFTRHGFSTEEHLDALCCVPSEWAVLKNDVIKADSLAAWILVAHGLHRRASALADA